MPTETKPTEPAPTAELTPWQQYGADMESIEADYLKATTAARDTRKAAIKTAKDRREAAIKAAAKKPAETSA